MSQGIHGIGQRGARASLAVIALGVLGSCASGGWFHRGPRPPALVGTWIDSAATTPRDTTLWILSASGSRRIVQTALSASGGGVAQPRVYTDQWYVQNENDSSRATFCFVRRARDGATCARFALDSTAATPRVFRRRLVVHSYDSRSDRTWVLVERRR